MGPSVDSHNLNARLLRYRSHPDQEDAVSLAEDLISAARYGDARGVAVSAQTDEPAHDARLLVLEGRAWYLDRDVVRAQAALVRAAKLDPRSGPAFRWLGEVLLDRGDVPRAVRALERARMLSPGDATVSPLLERAQAAATPPPPVIPVAAAVPVQPRIAQRAIHRTLPMGLSVEEVAPGLKSAMAEAAAQPAPPEPAFSRPPERPVPLSRLIADEEDTTGNYQMPDGLPEDTSPGALQPGFDDLSGGDLDAPLSASQAGERTAPGHRFSSPGARSSPGMQSSAGASTSPGARSSPGTQSSAGGFSSPGARSSPGTQSSAGASTSPGARSSPGGWAAPSGRLPSPVGLPSPLPVAPGRGSSPGTQSAPGRFSTPLGLPSPPAPLPPSSNPPPSSPGRLSSPGSQLAPARLPSPVGLSSPGLSSSPGRLSSPGSLPSSGSSSPGGYSSPGAQSSAGSTSSPGFQSTPGQVSWPGAWSSPGGASSPGTATSAGARSSPGRVSSAGQLDPPRADTVPGELGAAPRRRDLTPSTAWEAPSVVAAWPNLEPMEGRDGSHPALLRVGDMDITVSSSDSYPPPPSADLAVGASAGAPDDPAALLETLRAHGILEDASAVGPDWQAPRDVPRTGSRLKGALITVWAVTLVLLGGGYFGWTQWVAHRHSEATRLAAEAQIAAFDGDNAKLVDAERLLRQARDQHPRSTQVPRVELFVHAARVLESGSRELAGLRNAVARAEKLKVEAAYLAAGRAVLAAYSGAPDVASLLDQAIKTAKGEPALLYLAGRLGQRAGRSDASALLQAAAGAAPDLLAASLALIELAQEEGRLQEAMQGIDALLAKHPAHVRARLWQALLTADTADTARLLAALDAMGKEARSGAPIDRLLWSLARARVLRRNGQQEPAAQAVRDALAAGATEPRLLALIAAEARRSSQLGIAQQAAAQAVALAPRAATYRALLAGILVDRGEGARAFDLLAELSSNEPSLLRIRARAALQTGDPEALRAALAAIEPELKGDAPGVEVLALALRLRAAIEPSSRLASEARALLRRAPGDPEALRAAGEVALELREGSQAATSFGALVKLAPENAEAHYLLGRAQRMAMDAQAAETSLRRSLELAPGFASALYALGSLLLDSGRYGEADALYQELATRSPATARLGRAEALLGLGRVDDAQAQVSGLPEQDQATAAAREVAARVALAKRRPGDALVLLRPLTEGETRKPATLALYGDALYAADQVDAAAGAYEAALELDSDLPEALVGRAEVHLRAERAKDALELLEQAKDALATRMRGPDLKARMLMLFGHAYVQRDKRGDLEAARDMLREAVKEPRAPAEAYFWLGEALGGRRTPEAAAALKKYLELAPDGYYAARAKRALGPLL